MTLEKHQNLRANVGRLWFAGEGTSAEYFGFMHGAWFEGQEMAKRVAAQLKAEKNKKGGSSKNGPQMVRYEVLHGTTQLSEFNAGNGWPVSSFLDYDSDSD